MPLGFDTRPLLARGARSRQATGTPTIVLRGPRGPRGERGLPGIGGSYTEYIFKRQEDKPSTPVGNNPVGWFDAPPAAEPDYYPLWMSKAEKTYTGALIGSWSEPIQITGDTGFYLNYIFIRSATTPDTPTGSAPAGWSDAPPAADGNPLWVSKAPFDLITETILDGAVWSDPVQIEGSSISVQYSVNGEDSWHDVFAEGDIYMRQRVGTGSWSGAIRIVGEDGDYVEFIFKRNATAPATPTGTTIAEIVTEGWSDAPPAGTLPLWMSKAFFTHLDVIDGVWSTPIQLNGNDGAPGANGIDGTNGQDGIFREFVFVRSAGTPSTPTGNGIPSGWYDDPPGGSDPLWVSMAKQNLDGTLISGESWSAPVRYDGTPGANGIDGINGDDGIFREFAWIRSAGTPSTPTGNGIPSGWYDDPPSGSDPLWMSVAKQNLDGTLISGESWSTPIRHDGISVKVEYSVNGSSGWHSTFSTGDVYMRQSVDGGFTWSSAIQIVGEEGAGLEVQYSVNGVDGWHDTFTPGDIYMRQRIQGSPTWSDPIRIVGEQGPAGPTGPTVDQVAQPSIGFSPAKFSGSPTSTCIISTTTGGATIYYELNSDPPALYSGSFGVSSGDTILAWAEKAGMLMSLHNLDFYESGV